MAKQTHTQILGATPLQRTGLGAHEPVAATAAVRRMIATDGTLREAIDLIARGVQYDENDFRIHHRLDSTPQENIVIRSFPGEPIPIVMTEEESFRHYGPHQPNNHDEKERRKERQRAAASTGWGIAKFGDNLSWAIFLIVLTIAITLHCHPEFVRTDIAPTEHYCEKHCPPR